MPEIYNPLPFIKKEEREIEKYIRMSKGAYSRGLARVEIPQQALFRVARERFNIEPDSIQGL